MSVFFLFHENIRETGGGRLAANKIGMLFSFMLFPDDDARRALIVDTNCVCFGGVGYGKATFRFSRFLLPYFLFLLGKR